MPKHRGIFAFDYDEERIYLANPELIFLFILDEKLYTYKEKFEGRNYYSINPFNGEIIEEIGDNYEMINNLRHKSTLAENNSGYLFPEDI